MMYYLYMYLSMLHSALGAFLRPYIVVGLVLVAVLHQAGMMGLYDALWWYDVMMHGLGGLWVGLFFLAWHKSTPFLPSDTLRQVIRLLGLVLFVGLMWEMFEAGFDYTIGPQIGFGPLWGDPRQGVLFDSAEDLVLDVAGGGGAYTVN